MEKLKEKSTIQISEIEKIANKFDKSQLIQKKKN